ncbi:hypothetical protein BVRB_4g094220 [Beta vulgaris subsp. vulgaris]|nr:hypothetical protein BVRB_4g094220 [Beta vulgaris subsp. vulgaris]
MTVDIMCADIRSRLSFKIRVEDILDDERPPRGRDRPHVVAVVNLYGRIRSLSSKKTLSVR